jgi:hypothetical protein
LIKMGRQAEALPWLDRLVQEFSQSEYLEEARLRVAELKAAIPTPTPNPSPPPTS